MQVDFTIHSGSKGMTRIDDSAAPPPASGFSFRALIALLFQLRLRDRLSAANRDDGAHHWGL